MFLKKVLNQPNLVGTVLIALMVCAGFVYAVGFDGFNVETATGDEVEAWLAAAGGGSYSGGPEPCDCLLSFMPFDGCSTDLCESDDVNSKGHCGNEKAYCSDKCAQKGKGGCSTCSIYTVNDVTYNLQCANEGDLCGDNPEACQPGEKKFGDDSGGDSGKNDY